MPSGVGDYQNFVAQRRHEEQIHLGEDASHFLRDFPAKPIGLNKIQRKEIALGEKSWAMRRVLEL
jgi:hypothetical protein